LRLFVGVVGAEVIKIENPKFRRFGAPVGRDPATMKIDGTSFVARERGTPPFPPPPVTIKFENLGRKKGYQGICPILHVVMKTSGPA